MAREVRVQIYYKGEVIGLQRIDMIVDERLVVEVKSALDLMRLRGFGIRADLYEQALRAAGEWSAP